MIKYQVDANRSVLQRLGEQESAPGDNLILTIDSGIQAQLQESLQAGLEMARDLEMAERAEALEVENIPDPICSSLVKQHNSRPSGGEREEGGSRRSG